MIYLIYFQPFRVGTSSRLANMRNQPKDSNVQAEGRIFKARIKQLPAVPKIMLNTKGEIISNIARKTEKSSSDEDESNLDYLDDLELENDKK